MNRFGCGRFFFGLSVRALPTAALPGKRGMLNTLSSVKNVPFVFFCLPPQNRPARSASFNGRSGGDSAPKKGTPSNAGPKPHARARAAARSGTALESIRVAEKAVPRQLGGNVTM